MKPVHRLNILIVATMTSLLTGCGAQDPDFEPLPPQATGSAEISFQSGAYSQIADITPEGEYVYDEMPAVAANLSTLKAVRFESPERGSELLLLFSDQPLDDLSLIDPFGESNFFMWRQLNEDAASLYLQGPSSGEEFSGLAFPGPSLEQVSVQFDDTLDSGSGRVSGRLQIEVPAEAFDGVVRNPAYTASGTFDAPINDVIKVVGADCNSEQHKELIQSMTGLMQRLEGVDAASLPTILTPLAVKLVEIQARDQGEQAVARFIEFIRVEPEIIESVCQSGTGRIARAGPMVKFDYEGFQMADGGAAAGSFVMAWHEGAWKLGGL